MFVTESNKMDRTGLFGFDCLLVLTIDTWKRGQILRTQSKEWGMESKKGRGEGSIQNLTTYRNFLSVTVHDYF